MSDQINREKLQDRSSEEQDEEISRHLHLRSNSSDEFLGVSSSDDLLRRDSELSVSSPGKDSKGHSRAPSSEVKSHSDVLPDGTPKVSKVTKVMVKMHDSLGHLRGSSGSSSHSRQNSSGNHHKKCKKHDHCPEGCIERQKTILHMREVSVQISPEDVAKVLSEEAIGEERESGEGNESIEQRISSELEFEAEYIWVEPADTFKVEDIKEAQYIGFHINSASKLVHKMLYYDIENYRWVSVSLLILFLCILPTAVSSAWFSLIPLGDPDGTYSDKATWVFVVNPLTWVLMSYLIVSVFLGVLDERIPWRPWHTWVHIPILTYVVNVITVGFSVFFYQTYPANGILSLGVTMLSTLVGLRLKNHIDFYCPRNHYVNTLWTFSKCLITLFIFVVWLNVYIILFAVSSSTAQSILSFMLMIVAFIFKKILLAQTDDFPLEMAMCIAGLWVENLNDIFSTMAYPSVSNPEVTYIFIWFSKFAGDIWYVVFLFDWWFIFRVWIKSVFKKQRGVPIEEDIDLDDRGHSNIKPAYHRRQIRFFIWKILSQFCGQIFYMSVATCLRFSYNSDYFRFSEDNVSDLVERTWLTNEYTNVSDREFRNSLIFSGTNLTWIAFSAIIYYCYVRKYHQKSYQDLKLDFRNLVLSPNYIGFVLTIVVSNMFLVCTFIMYQSRVFFF
eukprot:Nk52_evm3s598 gene=Nk52_evmTU3s598